MDSSCQKTSRNIGSGHDIRNNTFGGVGSWVIHSALLANFVILIGYARLAAEPSIRKLHHPDITDGTPFQKGKVSAVGRRDTPGFKVADLLPQKCGVAVQVDM